MKTKMRNTLFVLIGLSSFAFAGEPVNPAPTNVLIQDDGTGEKCYTETTHIVNIGIGVGGNYYRGVAFGSYTRSPALSVSYEQPWSKKLGPGYLGVGAYFGYQSANYIYYGYYEHHWKYMSIAARGVYHWDVLNFAKAEVYGGALVGLRIQTYNYVSTDPNASANKLNDGNLFPIITAFAGARWYFAKNFALYGEAGSGVSYITGGISFKF